jgi:hypothetical protein
MHEVRSNADCRSELEMNELQGNKVLALKQLLAAGASYRTIVGILGMSKPTIGRYARMWRFDVTCMCGKKAGHSGWCEARYAFSPKRRGWVAKQWGKRSDSALIRLVDDAYAQSKALGAQTRAVHVGESERVRVVPLRDVRQAGQYQSRDGVCGRWHLGQCRSGCVPHQRRTSGNQSRSTGETNMARGKKNTQAVADVPASAAIADRGISTAADFLRMMTALLSDTVTGRVQPQRANATCNVAGKIIRMVELQHKYGKPMDGTTGRLQVSEYRLVVRTIGQQQLY